MYYEEYHPKYFNTLMVKLAYDFNKDSCMKMFKSKELDEDPNIIFADCLKVIAPKTRFYFDDDFYDANNCSYGAEMIVFKSDVIKKAYGMKTRLEKYLKKTHTPPSRVKELYNKLKSSISCAVDWLKYIDHYSGGIFDWNYSKDKKGVVTSLKGCLSFGADVEVLNALIQYLIWLNRGVLEAEISIKNLDFKEDVYE